jgi:uncharacterized protein (DUF1778 family)
VARKPRADTISDRVSIRFTPAERWRIVVAARVNRQTLSAFVRAAVEEAASDCLEDEDERLATRSRGKLDSD